MQEAVLVDLDSTLFDNRDREHFIKDPEGNRYPTDQVDWAAYSAACVTDKPIDSVVQLCRMLDRSGYLIFHVSGRSEVAEEETTRQLDKLGYRNRGLFMRREGDKTPNGEFKVKAIETIERMFNCRVVLAVDDYPSARDALEDAGVPCILVRENAR